MADSKGKYVLVTTSFHAVGFEGKYFESLEDACYALLNFEKRYVTDIDGFIAKRVDFDNLVKWIDGGFKDDAFKKKLDDSLQWNVQDAEYIITKLKFELLCL